MNAVLLETWSLRITISPTPPDIGEDCHTMVVEERRRMGSDIHGEPIWAWDATVFHLREDSEGQEPGLRLVSRDHNRKYADLVLKHIKTAPELEQAFSVLYLIK
jgi:hypothetical protein